MKTIYSLTRDLSGDRELIHLSTDRKHLADLMRTDSDKWTVPLNYTIEITSDFDNFWHEARTDAFIKVANALRKIAKGYPDRQIDAIVFRMAARVAEDMWSEERCK